MLEDDHAFPRLADASQDGEAVGFEVGCVDRLHVFSDGIRANGTTVLSRDAGLRSIADCSRQTDTPPILTEVSFGSKGSCSARVPTVGETDALGTQSYRCFTILYVSNLNRTIPSTMPRLSSKAALAAYLRDRVGVVIESADLQAAANNAVQYSRRLRELRAEGWKISSHHDRADLKPGQYVLEELPPDKPPYRFAHSIPSSLRAQILERNGYTCQMCGAGAGDPDERAGGRPTRLQVGHITDLSHGGQNVLSNLRALCSTCNQGAKNLVQEPPSWVWLLSQLRRATRSDQRKALDWLRKKFDEAARNTS